LEQLAAGEPEVDGGLLPVRKALASSREGNDWTIREDVVSMVTQFAKA
jgi:hypothetical protein